MTTGWLIWARQTARGYFFRVATGAYERGGRGTGCCYMPSHATHVHATMQGYNNDKQMEVTAVTHACCCQDLQQGFSARIILNLPFWVGNVIATLLDAAQAVTMGLFGNTILTRDQVTNLQYDNVVSDGAKTLADLGVEATDLDVIVADYLWVYRPSGQYAEIKNSARNLRA